MKRRQFFSVSASALAFNTLTGFIPAMAQKSGHMVDTPRKRAEYLARMLKLICTDIGPHPVGSPECERVKDIIIAEMERALPRVELNTFTFDRWMLSGEPSLTIDGILIEAYPRIQTAGTPQTGISGVAVKVDKPGVPSYGIADGKTGKIIAYLSPYNGTARPTHAPEGELRRLPTVNIGNGDVPLVEQAITRKAPVHLNVPVTVIPRVEVANVVGTLPGESSDELLFLAHYDTVYTAPGANDNTASVIIMLMIAHAFSGKRPRKTIRFVATTGEERNGFMGATHYADTRKREGTLSDIKYIVNFDSGTWNPDVQIWTEDKALQELIMNIDRDLKINGTPIPVDRTGFSLDAKPFADSGARAVYVESTGQDKPYLWHRPDDTPGNVQEFIVEINYLLFHEYARRVMEL